MTQEKKGERGIIDIFSHYLVTLSQPRRTAEAALHQRVEEENPGASTGTELQF